MLLWWNLVSGKDRRRGPECEGRNKERRSDRHRWFLQDDRNDAAHRGDAVECQALAGLLRRLRLLILHHFHAIRAHLKNSRWDRDHALARRKSGLLAEDAKKRSEEKQKAECASHYDLS